MLYKKTKHFVEFYKTLIIFHLKVNFFSCNPYTCTAFLLLFTILHNDSYYVYTDENLRMFLILNLIFKRHMEFFHDF